jgi:hypothetical protein
MYFPYLRGRQFELIALREFATERGERDNLLPIIEPVKQSFNSFKIALKMFGEANLPFSLILNPQVGDISNLESILENLSEYLNEIEWTPSFILSNNIDHVSQVIERKGFNAVMLICADSVDTSTDEFLEFVKSDFIKYIVLKENRTLKRRLKDSGKNLIRLDSCFNQQKRNADYLRMPEEKFTEEHLFFKEDGYLGFSDFTTLPHEFTEGGTTPYAVSIHLTYQKENEEIWIRHFTSETNDDQANIQGKFAEAARKAVNFLNEKSIDTIAANELRDYYNSQKYPGLGMIKKISIKHHLELINIIL